MEIKKISQSYPNPDQSDYTWIGSANNASSDSEEIYLIQNRDRIEVLGGWSAEINYEYDEIALIRLINHVTGELCYYALRTSGCSCPSPSETWIIDFGPATQKELIKYCLLSEKSELIKACITEDLVNFS